MADYSAGNLYLNIDSVANDTLKDLDAVIGRLNLINSGLGKIGKNNTKISSLNSGSSKSSNSFAKSFNRLFKIGGWTAVLYSAKRLGGYMAQIVQKGSDFGENLNLWTVAMGQEFLPQATEFVNKLNEAYGISKDLLMNSQAIFKNMLGSLGQISDETAYRLSEGITQMALDYASLYNVQFEDAMTKFQAALAGQVRPIRSVAGYDITENTLFQLYQQLGGTKTMRQLNRTEKQLLAIYAVFEQMGKSGAVGDLNKTINSFANQSRVMASAWSDVQTYAGLTVTRILEQYNVMKYINAVLIFMSRILEGLATSLDTGLGNSGDVFGDMESGATDATDAVEGLKSALLDFDKFRALDQANAAENALGIDQNILDAMTKYDSILENAELASREIADNWLKTLGFVDANNDGIIDMQGGVDELIEKIRTLDWGEVGKGLAKAINSVDISDFISWLGYSVGEIFRNTFDLGINLIINIDWEKFFTDTFKNISKFFTSFWDGIFNTTKGSDSLDLFFDLLDKNKKYSSPSLFARGGLPDKGSAFVAGEDGAEYVYNMPSGQSGVANVQQIAQATYSGTMRALNDWWGGRNAREDIPQLTEANPTGMYQAVTGVARAQGKVWSKA